MGLLLHPHVLSSGHVGLHRDHLPERGRTPTLAGRVDPAVQHVGDDWGGWHGLLIVEDFFHLSGGRIEHH